MTKYYDKWEDVPTDHIVRETVQERELLTRDIDCFISINALLEFVKDMNFDESGIVVDYYSQDHYGDAFTGLSIQYPRPETDAEYAGHKISYQKEYMRKHKRPTDAQLAKIQKDNQLREAKDRKEYARLKKIFEKDE